MSSLRLKEKLSTLVPSQLPEFIQSDYSTFISFLEAYYEFLEQDQNAQELLQNARSYADIDRTIDSFVQYFLQQYCTNLPVNVLADKKVLIKNIQDIYRTKGTLKSYELLFRILYNKDIEVFLPSTQILRASDGKWVQQTSIFVTVTVGDPDQIVTNNASLISPTNNTVYPIFIERKRSAYGGNGVSSDTFEYFFNNKNNIPINIGDVIEYENFKGVVTGVPISVDILNEGVGFREGEILPLTSGLGTNARLKITKVTSTGGVKHVQFINFGPGYVGDFYNSFSAIEPPSLDTTFNYITGAASIVDQTRGIVERGEIVRDSGYASVDYFGEGYVGTTISTFFNNTTKVPITGPASSISASTGLPSDVTLYVRIGTKAKYPGYFKTNDGFLSDDIFLENEDYYQPFSYVIKVSERLSDYKKAVLDLLHPAGTKLIGELTLDVDVNAITEITTTLRLLTSYLQDAFGVDDGDFKILGKNLSDTVVALEADAKDITKPLTETFAVIDSSFFDLTKNLTDLVSVVETELLKTVDAVYVDNAPVQEETSIDTGINIQNNIDGVSDNGDVFFTNYTIEDYFAEDYVGTHTYF